MLATGWSENRCFQLKCAPRTSSTSSNFWKLSVTMRWSVRSAIGGPLICVISLPARDPDCRSCGYAWHPAKELDRPDNAVHWTIVEMQILELGELLIPIVENPVRSGVAPAPA